MKIKQSRNWSDRIASMKCDMKHQSKESLELLAAYNEWCIMNTKIEKGCFKKLAKQIRER